MDSFLMVPTMEVYRKIYRKSIENLPNVLLRMRFINESTGQTLVATNIDIYDYTGPALVGTTPGTNLTGPTLVAT